MKNIFTTAICAILFTLLLGTVVEATTIRVGLVRNFYNQNSITITSTAIDVGRGDANDQFVLNRSLTSPTGFTIHAESGGIVVRAGGSNVFTFTAGEDYGGPMIRGSGGQPIEMGNYSYRGAIEFRAMGGGRVSAINVVSIEDYLQGVLPMEMSPSFHMDALRAQAVAARTFAMYPGNQTRFRNRGFHLCDTTSSQMYSGVGVEDEIINQAIRDTAGLMMFAPGENIPLFTPYFSSSGGSTDNSENVWVETLPHLRAVYDPYEIDARIWTRSYTWAQLTHAVAMGAPAVNVGTVTGIRIVENMGRVQELTFIGTAGQWTATKQQIITVFRHVDSSLHSRHFTIAGATAGNPVSVSVTNGTTTSTAPITNFSAISRGGTVIPVNTAYAFDGIATRHLNRTLSISGGTGITINGRGWGHGVGMSQHGANAMAIAGHDFMAILRHYYTGVDIRPIHPTITESEGA